MSYTEDQIKKYLEILHNYTKKPEDVSGKAKCINCQNDSFCVESGYNICDFCGTTNGHVLGYFDLKEYNRFHFRKKSSYQRKYHYEKKVDQISKRINLTDDEKYELYSKLMTIDNHVMEILNKQFCRKRMISIFYLIKKLLEETDYEKSSLVYLKISPQTLENYEKWWDRYKRLKK